MSKLSIFRTRQYFLLPNRPCAIPAMGIIPWIPWRLNGPMLQIPDIPSTKWIRGIPAEVESISGQRRVRVKPQIEGVVRADHSAVVAWKLGAAIATHSRALVIETVVDLKHKLVI